MAVFSIRSIKTQLILYLCAFALFLGVRDRDAAFLLLTLLSVASAVCFEALLSYPQNKKFLISESAVISGLIIGFVISSSQPWYIFVVASFLAMLSKLPFIARSKRIFNPAAFGIFLSIILFGASTQWKGAYIWYITVPVGFYFAYKMRKLELLAGYAAVSLLLFGGQAVMVKAPLLGVLGYFNYFYIFVMVIEPKTTPVGVLAKYIFGMALAVLIFILTGAGVRFDAELFSLLVMNAAAPLLNKIRLKGRIQ